MVAFGNPVAGTIRPPGSPLIVGSFRVTSTFAEHVASGRGPGIDIGNGRCNDPILAMGPGIVSLAGLIGNAKVVRIKHPNGYETAAAHLATIEVKLGQAVVRGQRIGTLGSTGATACHDHGGCKDPSGVEVDWWPLLIQNGATEDEDDMDPSFSPKPNRTVTVNKGARHRLAPSLDPANIAIASDPGGALGGVLNLALMGTVVGEAVSGNAIWYAYWRPETSKVYYLHTSTCGPETPWEQVSLPADCSAEVQAATTPLSAALNIANQKISAAKNALA
jgi:hypothetical protein